MFELTDTLTYAVPVMLSVLVAKTVADALEPKGIYDLVIELSQLPYLDYKSDYAWDNLQISDVVSREVPSIRIDQKNTVQSLSDKLIGLISSGENDMGFPILRPDAHDDGVRLVGYIGANELEHALSTLPPSLALFLLCLCHGRSRYRRRRPGIRGLLWQRTLCTRSILLNLLVCRTRTHASSCRRSL